MHHTSASHKHIRGCILTRNMSEKCPKASPAFLFGEPPEFATEIIDLTWQKPRMSLDDYNPLPPFPLIEHKSVITACSRWECYYKAIYQERGVDGVLSLDGEVSLGYRGRFDVNFMLRCSLEWLAQKNRQLNSCRYFSRNVSIFQNDVLLSKVKENGPNIVSDVKLVTWGQLPPSLWWQVWPKSFRHFWTDEEQCCRKIGHQQWKRWFPIGRGAPLCLDSHYLKLNFGSDHLKFPPILISLN